MTTNIKLAAEIDLFGCIELDGSVDHGIWERRECENSQARCNYEKSIGNRHYFVATRT